MSKNIIIQIGLNTRIELDFLTLPSFKDVNKVYCWADYKWGVPRHLIDPLDEEPFRLFGVEMNPDRVQQLKARYEGYPRIHILNRVICSEDQVSVEHNSYSLYEHANNNDVFYQTPSLRLQTFMTEIQASYPESCIWGVWMNIEFAEKDVIEGIDWSTFTPPEFMKIAMHSEAIREICDAILTSNGYTRLGTPDEYSTYTLS